MDRPDEVIHQSMRLKIMAALAAEPAPGAIDFARLKTISGATDGNLGAHIVTLEGAGYVVVDKEPVGKRMRTSLRITPVGREAFAGHLAYLRRIIDEAGV